MIKNLRLYKKSGFGALWMNIIVRHRTAPQPDLRLPAPRSNPIPSNPSTLRQAQAKQAHSHSALPRGHRDGVMGRAPPPSVPECKGRDPKSKGRTLGEVYYWRPGGWLKGQVPLAYEQGLYKLSNLLRNDEGVVPYRLSLSSIRTKHAKTANAKIVKGFREWACPFRSASYHTIPLVRDPSHIALRICIMKVNRL